MDKRGVQFSQRVLEALKVLKALKTKNVAVIGVFIKIALGERDAKTTLKTALLARFAAHIGEQCL